MGKQPKIVYLAGPMHGIPGWNKPAFHEICAMLTLNENYIVLNPACIPAGMPEENYMPICLAMLQQADAIALMPGWMTSDGAVLEMQYAKYQGKEIIDIEKTYGLHA